MGNDAREEDGAQDSDREDRDENAQPYCCVEYDGPKKRSIQSP
jgi:hypothetical protein